MNDREISLIDLMSEILLKWRVIIVWMLAGGILMGCYSYMHSCKTSQAQKEQLNVLNQQSELEHLQSNLTEMQMNNVDTAIGYELLWEAKNAYLQNSIKMHIDPLNVPRALFTFQVIADDVEAVQKIEKVYMDMVPDGLAKWLSEKTEDEVSDATLSEVISLHQDFGIWSSDIGSYNTLSLAESGTFKVAICHISEEQCLKLAEYVDEYFQEQQTQLSQKMGNHQIQLVTHNFSYIMDIALLDEQQSIQSNMMQWSTNAAKLKDAFSEEEWQYYNYLAANKLQEDSAGDQTGNDEIQEMSAAVAIQPSVSMKYVFMGMILFAFIYVCFIFLKYILSTRIRVTDDITVIYEVPELGTIPVKDSRKRFFAFVDNWILNLRQWNKRKFTMEEAIGLASVAIKMAARKDNLKEVYCIGCNLKKNTFKTAEMIQSILKDADISMKILNNVLYDQEAMEQLLSAEGAFLLEKAGETLYNEISRELDLLCRQEIKVLGIIVVE